MVIFFRLKSTQFVLYACCEAPKRRARHGVNPIASNMDDVSDMEAVPDVHGKKCVFHGCLL